MGDLVQTGDINQDIDNILNEFGNINKKLAGGDLRMVAYGRLTIVMPASSGITRTASFNHSLGYVPFFIGKMIYEPGDGYGTTDQAIADGPNLVDGYTYNLPTTKTGLYLFGYQQFRADTKNFYVDYTVRPNSPGFTPLAGNYNFSFFLFSKPIM